LRRGPTSVTASGLLGALKRIDDIGTLDLTDLDLSKVPMARRNALARYGMSAKAQALRQMTPERRIATLLVTAQHLEAVAYDVLDVFDLLVLSLGNRVDRQGLKARLETLPSLDKAAQTLRHVVLQVIEAESKKAELNVSQLFEAVFAVVPKEQMLQAAEVVADLTKNPEEIHAEEMLRRYSYVRQFLLTFITTMPFHSTDAGKPVLAALRYLLELEGRKKIELREVVSEVVTKAWHKRVVEGEHINRPAYTLCVLEVLRESLRRRDVFVTGSARWNDPRIRLLSDKAWQEQKSKVCLSLGLTADPDSALAMYAQQLDDAYHQVAARLDDNHEVSFKSIKGKKGERPVLEADAALEETTSLRALRDAVAARLPKVDLPELLLEVNAWTGFSQAFTHISESSSVVDDLTISVCALLVAEACNVGLEPMVKPAYSALTRHRLSWVDQHYLRAETLAAANARLVNHQATLALAQQWGGGHLASVDGLRFVVPVRTINAAPNPRYFGPGRGVTYLNFVSDQMTGFHGIVVPGTLRDSLYILDGLLEQTTNLEPKQIVSDTHGYTDIVFGLFHLLGYQFSPRLADLPDKRFWRMNKEATYGKLNGLAHHYIRPKRIMPYWDDILRVAGSLETGAVKASDLLRVLQGGGQPTGLGKAIAEFGRIAKTLHLLAYLNDESYRRKIGHQLSVHESRHSLARIVFHGQRGDLRQRYREGQEDQLGALGLVVKAIALWNTCYTMVALEQLEATGYEVKSEDVLRLSPLGHSHIHMLGRYQFLLPDLVQQGKLRSLRDPNNADDDD
jgi:TnpA family transposase